MAAILKGHKKQKLSQMRAVDENYNSSTANKGTELWPFGSEREGEGETIFMLAQGPLCSEENFTMLTVQGNQDEGELEGEPVLTDLDQCRNNDVDDRSNIPDVFTEARSLDTYEQQPTVAVDEYATVAADEYATEAADEYATVAADEYATVAADHSTDGNTSVMDTSDENNDPDIVLTYRPQFSENLCDKNLKVENNNDPNEPVLKPRNRKETVSASAGDRRKKSVKNFRCSHCDKNFTAKNTLIKHERIHTGERPFGCHLCPADFTRKDRLTAHLRIHTGEKPYQCAHCTSAFTTGEQLAKHIKHHTNVRDFACKTCGRAFTALSDLQRHQRVHTGEKPYRCDVCNRDFGRKYSLSVHSRRHSQERPYVCLSCDKGFHTSSHLSVHLKTEHN